VEACVLDKNGVSAPLPVLLSWDISHSCHSCDAFEVTVPVTEGLGETLASASEFICRHEGRTVFCGVVDEYELRAGESGATAMISGRGYGARLMDNEAESAEYWNPGIRQILENHVYPYGIKKLRSRDINCAGRFPVYSGSSQWRVLRDFCFFGGEVTPRFDREGTLILDGSVGDTVTLAHRAITRQVWRDRRYGVFSQVLVKNPALGVSSTAENSEFISRGGLCRRVVNVPRYTQYDAMRHTGEYQLRQSRQGNRVMFITMPLLFAAFAGDRVVLEDSPLGLSGRFLVRESRCAADGEHGETRLELEKEE
jgi:hypothetical protein